LTENAVHESAGHEIARHDKYRMKIDCITVQCAFLLNFMYSERVNVENINIAVFSNLYTLCGRISFAGATKFNRYVVNVAHQHRWCRYLLR